MIHVEEKPLLARFSIDAEGVEAADIESAIGLRRGLPFGAVEEHETRLALEDALGGAFEVSLSVVPAPEAEGHVELTVQVGPAPSETIESLRFEGNHEVSDDEIAEAIESRPRGWTTWITRRDRLRADRVEEDLERIRALYRDRGYLDARVGPTVPSTELVIPIFEGRRYRLAAIDVTPGSLLSLEEGRERLPPSGGPYSQRAIDTAVEGLERYYRDRGYPSVTVIRERDVVAPGEVSVQLRVEEGPFYRVGRIVFRGHSRHRDRDLRQHLDLAESDRFHQGRLTRRGRCDLAVVDDRKRLPGGGPAKRARARPRHLPRRRGRPIRVSRRWRPERNPGRERQRSVHREEPFGPGRGLQPQRRSRKPAAELHRGLPRPVDPGTAVVPGSGLRAGRHHLPR